MLIYYIKMNALDNFSRKESTLEEIRSPLDKLRKEMEEVGKVHYAPEVGEVLN
jgi:hypothetical protein